MSSNPRHRPRAAERRATYSQVRDELNELKKRVEYLERQRQQRPQLNQSRREHLQSAAAFVAGTPTVVQICPLPIKR